MKKQEKIHVDIEKELKQKLKDKAESLGMKLSAFVRMVLANSLKGELVIKQ